MGYRVSTERMNEILTALSDRYQVYGPRWDAQKKRVQYAQVRNVGQIVYDRQSDFSPKAAFYPVSQVMFSFREDGVEEQVPADERGILIFARACDLNAIRRQDALFLKNGGAEDLFYKRMRERVKFVLMECAESFENCFCASLGTNVAEEYAMAVRFGADDLLVQVKDAAFADLFAEMVNNLEKNPFQDFLGSMYMELGLGNDHAGQFFTPYNVCRAMAEITVPKDFPQFERPGYITINDPACGAGATLIVTAKKKGRKVAEGQLMFDFGG